MENMNNQASSEAATTTKPNAALWGQSNKVAEPTTMLTLPSGFVIEVRRPALTTWLISGRLPEKFLSEAMSVARQAESEDDSVPFADSRAKGLMKDLGDKEMLEMVAFMRDFVTAAVVHPRIVVDAPADSADEIDPSRIPEADFYFIFAWASGQTDDAPVATTKGNMTVGGVSNFRKKRGVSRTRRNG